MCKKQKPRAWERAGLKSEEEYHELLNRLGYKEATLDVCDKDGFRHATLLHVGNGVFVLTEPLEGGNGNGLQKG